MDGLSSSFLCLSQSTNDQMSQISCFGRLACDGFLGIFLVMNGNPHALQAPNCHHLEVWSVGLRLIGVFSVLVWLQFFPQIVPYPKPRLVQALNHVGVCVEIWTRRLWRSICTVFMLQASQDCNQMPEAPLHLSPALRGSNVLMQVCFVSTNQYHV